MASSGTINGNQSGYNPYLRINWNIDQTDIPGNRTRLRLRLYLMHPYAVYYSATKSGVLQGNSFSSTTNVSGTGSTLLRTQYIWVSHNSDGSKTQRLSASFNIAITFGGSRLNTLSVSGNAYLNSIPRGSTLSAFSFPTSFQPSTSNKINYTVKRHSGNYRHQLQLRDGSVTVAQWDNLDSNGSSSVTVSSSQANSILKRMSSTTSKSFTLRLATRRSSEGSWIGNVHTRTATASVHSNVKPTISSTSAKPIGNSWAVGKGFYVQGQTGVQAEFSSTARGGAGVRSRNISIGSLSSGGSVVGSVFRHSQTRVNTTGNVTITYKITDTRGRTASSKRTINVRAYTPPKITDFTVGRSSPTSSTVTIKSKGSIHGMGGQNTGTMTVKQQGVTSNVRSRSLNNTTPSFNDSFNRTVATASSVDFTITVTDSLGNSATSTSTVGTAFMEFSIRKGTGVGIGKVHEKGVIDVAGEAYFEGDLYVNNVNMSSMQSFTDVIPNGTAKDTISFWQNLPQGTYYVYGQQIPNQPSSYGVLVQSTQLFGSGSDFSAMWYSQAEGPIYRKSGNGNRMTSWERVSGPERGSNSNGDWVRFNDGTQICQYELVLRGEVGYGAGTLSNLYRTGMKTWDFPKDFSSSPSVSVIPNMPGSNSGGRRATTTTLDGVGSSYAKVQTFLLTTTNENLTIYLSMTAIGRWK